jgi:glucose/mannose-6-phosphate isomerase
MITHQSSLNDFTSQIQFVLDTYKSHSFKAKSFSNIVLGGLGGSGISAQIVKSWYFDKSPIPLETVADYHLPAYCDKNTLVILNSYSGATEETLSLFKDAIEKKCTILCISCGGPLANLAKDNQLICYQLEAGFQPRMTIGYGLTFLLMILGELFSKDVRVELEEVIEQFEKLHDYQIDSAKSIAQYFKPSIKHKFVIVADKYFAPIATRFCQQLNENAKLEGFLNVLPEANHNVIESYYGRLNTNFIFLYCDLNPRVHARFDFLTSHLELENNKVLNMLIPEYSIFSIFDIIYRLDWVSLYLGEEHGFDPMKIKNIMELKAYLADLEIIDDPESE